MVILSSLNCYKGILGFCLLQYDFGAAVGDSKVDSLRRNLVYRRVASGQNPYESVSKKI